jgi:hypothetical protein
MHKKGLTMLPRIEKLNRHQYRMKSASIEVAETRLMALAKPHDEARSTGLASGLASSMAYRIDAATLGLQRGWAARMLSLDALWEDQHQRMVKDAGTDGRIPNDRPDYRLAFGIFQSGNDVLIQNLYPRPSHRRFLLSSNAHIEPYGLDTPQAPSTPDEQAQRLQDWANARWVRRLVVCNGVLERPSIEDVAAKLPSLDYRAYVFAVEALSEREGNLSRTDSGHAEHKSPAAFRDLLQSSKGKAALKEMQEEIQGKLMPAIPVDLLGKPVALAA